MLKFPRKMEKSAKSVDEAKAAVLAELGISADEVEFKVIEEGTKGFLGIGSKEATVEATLIEPEVTIAKAFLSGVLEKMGVEVEMTAKLNDEGDVCIELEGDNLGIIIGKRGDTLDSLQYLTSLVVNRESDDYLKVIIDAENYREKRREALVALAARLAAKVERTGKRHTLEPMNPYERRIIHSALQGNENIITRSVGEDPYRKVVIESKRRPKPQYTRPSYPKQQHTKHSDFESYASQGDYPINTGYSADFEETESSSDLD